MFFQDLEAYDNLDTGNNAHIWLLHHLFLREINRDIQDWLGSWNNHTMTIRGDRSRTPHDMYFFGMIEEGPRGIIDDDELAGYGIDWEDIADNRIRRHHDAANPADSEVHLDDNLADNPFEPQVPENLANVEVEGPACPLTVEQIQVLDAGPEMWEGRSMNSYRLRWKKAFEVCRHMYVV
jgi:hypothetical protein